MVYTKEKFKELWESDESGGGITYNDCADCAKAWGLYSMPRCANMRYVVYDVCKEAGVSEPEMPENLYREEKEECAGWHRFPNEKPSQHGEYLVRGIGGLNNKLHHWVCLWIDEYDNKDIERRFFYGGNEFKECPSGKFEWMDLREL